MSYYPPYYPSDSHLNNAYNLNTQYPTSPGYACSMNGYSPTESASMHRGSSNSSASSHGSANSYGGFTASPSLGYFDPLNYPSTSEDHNSIAVNFGGSVKTQKKDGHGKQHGDSSAGILHCLYQKCEYQTKRQYDLDRHQKTHFGSSHRFDCPGRGCGRVGDFAFDRKDHLTEHLRKVHAKDIPKTPRRGKGSKKAVDR